MLLLALLTFALPWVVTWGTANPYLEAKELLLLTGGWGLILWTLLGRPSLPSMGLRNPWLKGLGLFVLLTGVAHFQWAYLWRTPTQQQVVYNFYTWLPTLHVLMALLLLRTLALHWFLSPRNVIQLTEWLCLSGVLVAAYAIGQALGLDQWYVNDAAIGNTWHGRVYAGFGNPSYLAIYLASLCPLYLLFKLRRYLAYLLIVLIALALTQVRYAWGLAGIGLLGYGLSRSWQAWQPWKRGVILSLTIIGLGFWLSYAWGWAKGDERWVIWQQAWELVRVQTGSGATRVDAWTGRGLGAYELVSTFGWAHNEWLQALVELGVIGTGLWLGAVVWTTRRAWQQATQSLLDAGWFGVWLSLLAASLLHFPFHLAPLIWTGLCAWAIIERDQGAAADG